MATRMLVDATHSEETRVVTVRGNRLEEFDFETSTKTQLKGNIYLAKVTRVEPSLQAAFVEYGGNRHGFLAFSEIHPDYYQIPVADREELLEQQAAEDKAAAKAEDDADDRKSGEKAQADGGDEGESGEPIESLGGDEIEEVSPRRNQAIRRYKIQEVIKRRQILLVQVAKEERGNKGAALTTYLSLAGRYCVLMPNTARGGGISRKIVNMADRKRLKGITNSLAVPDGMGVIVRTAGMKRSKAEIKRDYEYLLRLWDDIRSMTLESTAPALIYEEANLIKRSIRDLYNREIEEILVEGEEGYRTAKDFMRMLMPSHAVRVKRYKDRIPLYHRYQVEQQFDSMYRPEVTLRSGGYIVINPTEALVSIDVNSGKATKERNIEETAYKTNLEAAEEIARQLRLRDLAGLIVIDFIDMDDSQNNRNVERRLKECLKVDRARIQVGRISPFGLLEMSRQRMRPSLIEASTHICAACAGTGVVRSTESTVLHVLRAIEEEGIRERYSELTVHVPTNVALYMLNQKREMLNEIEQRYNFKVFVEADDSLIPPDHRIDRLTTKGTEEKAPAEGAVEESTEDKADSEEAPKKRSRRRRRRRSDKSKSDAPADTPESTEEAAEDAQASGAEDSGDETTDEEAPKKRRRRSRRGSRRKSKEERAADSDTETGEVAPDTSVETDTSEETKDSEAEDAVAADAEAEKPKPRRRRRRKPAAKSKTDAKSDAKPDENDDGSAESADVSSEDASRAEPAPQESVENDESMPMAASAPEAGDETQPIVDDPEPMDSPEPIESPDESVSAPAPMEMSTDAPVDEPEGDSKPKRRGWWRRRS